MQKKTFPPHLIQLQLVLCLLICFVSFLIFPCFDTVYNTGRYGTDTGIVCGQTGIEIYRTYLKF
jgi:hypothetical protein